MFDNKYGNTGEMILPLLLSLDRKRGIFWAGWVVRLGVYPRPLRGGKLEMPQNNLPLLTNIESQPRTGARTTQLQGQQIDQIDSRWQAI